MNSAKPVYHAVAEKSGKWWAVTITDLPDPKMCCVTQGRDWDDALFMARDVIALMLEVDEDSFDLVMTEKTGQI